MLVRTLPTTLLLYCFIKLFLNPMILSEVFSIKTKVLWGIKKLFIILDEDKSFVRNVEM